MRDVGSCMYVYTREYVQEGVYICWVLMFASNGCLGLRPGGWQVLGEAEDGESGSWGSGMAAVGVGEACEMWVA